MVRSGEGYTEAACNVAKKKGANEATCGLKMALSIDHREKGLISFLQCLRPRVASLLVGDVVCTYETGQAWAAERKTADDLAKSIIDGPFAAIH